MTTPTLTQMEKVYYVAAAVERMKCGRPGENTVENTRLGVRAFRRWLNERRESLGYARIGFDEDFPRVSIVKPPLIHRYLADLLAVGTKPLTAMTYVAQLRQLFAKWIRPYYEDRGWTIPPFPSLGGRPAVPRYVRPAPALLAKVKRWYEELSAECGVQSAERWAGRGTKDLWLAATMMLEFGMRNGDILRLRRENFVEHEGRVYLNYTPHKTAHSSRREVRWPVHADLWRHLREAAFDFDESVFAELNRQMRALGFTGSKGAYELRKICIDHVYQKYGAEMAVSISGDDIKTIIRYYADPSQPNIGEVRIISLL